MLSSPDYSQCRKVGMGRQAWIFRTAKQMMSGRGTAAFKKVVALAKDLTSLL